MSNKKAFSIFDKKPNVNKRTSNDDILFIGEFNASSNNDNNNKQNNSSNSNVKSEKVLDLNSTSSINITNYTIPSIPVPSIPIPSIPAPSIPIPNDSTINSEKKACFTTLFDIKKEIFYDDDNFVNQFFSQEEDVSYDSNDESVVFQTSFQNADKPAEDVTTNSLPIGVNVNTGQNVKKEPVVEYIADNDDEEDEEIKLIYQDRAFLAKIDKIIDLTQDDDDGCNDIEDEDGFRVVRNHSRKKQQSDNQEQISPIIIGEKQPQPQSPLVIFPKSNSGLIVLSKEETPIKPKAAEKSKSNELITELMQDTNSNDSDDLRLISISDELEKSYLDNKIAENSASSSKSSHSAVRFEASSVNKETKSSTETNKSPKKADSFNKSPSIEKKNLDTADTQKKVKNLKRLRVIMDDSFEEDKEVTITDNKTTPPSKRASLSSCLDEILDVESRNSEAKEKFDRLKHVSEKNSAKPPAGKSIYKCLSNEGEISTPISSPLRQNSSSEKKTVTGEPIGVKRSMIVIEPLNDRKRKLSTPNIEQMPVSKRSSSACPSLQTDSNDSSNQPRNIQISKPASILNTKPSTSYAKPSTSTSKATTSNQASASDDILSAIDAEKKKYLETLKLPPKPSKPAQKSSKIMEEIKNLKYPINNPKLKTKKAANASNDLNLTQFTNLAKLENRKRIGIILAEKQPATNSAVARPNERPQPLNSPKIIAVNEDMGKRLEAHKNRSLDQPRSSSENPAKRIQKPGITNNENVHLNINKNKANIIEDGKATAKPNSKPASLEKNDVLGNIMGEISKQTPLVAPPNSGDKQNKSSENKYDLKHFLFKVLRWTFSWLIEQEKIGKPPPVVDELFPMVDKFKSYDDYYNTMFPLLLSEMWEEITKSWREQKQNRPEKRSYNNAHIWLKSTEKLGNEDKSAQSELIQIIFQIVVDPNQKSTPYEDDLIRFRMNLLEAKQTKEYDFFGIVKKSHKLKQDDPMIIGSVRDHLRELETKSAQDRTNQMFTSSSPSKPNPNSRSEFDVYEFAVLARYRKYVPKIGEKVDYEFITCLSSIIRRVKALISFRYSPIVKSVLRSDANDPIFWLNPDLVKKCGDKPFKFNCINQYNESQQAVVMEASSIINYKNEPKLYFIQGPPGTGKSHTIIGIINAIFARLTMHQQNFNEATQNQSTVNTNNHPIPNMNNFKMLICSPSNGGCDELTRRIKALKDSKYSNLNTLNKRDFTIVRVGRSESIHKDSDDFNLDFLCKKKFEDLLRKKQCEKSSSLHDHFKTLQNTENTLIKKIKLLKSSSTANEKIIKEMETQLSELQKKKHNFEIQLKKSGQNANISAADRRKLDLQAKEMVLREADIIISTLNYSGNQIMDCLTVEKNGGNCIVNVIIVDEAAQCLEVDSLIPLRFGCNKIIQVGDPEQLPATVLSRAAQNVGLSQSLFERVYQNFCFLEKSPIKMLYVQYRMHPEICAFPSKNFYKGKLISDKDTLAKRVKKDLDPYLIYDITDGQEIGDENNGAIYNPKEAEKVLEFCLMLINKKFNLNIGIITPYQRQVQYLKEIFAKKQLDKIEIGTVDAYQGREKDIILFSSVRANSSNKSIGFLINRQRLNVSLTRAKFALYIFCHVESLKVNEDWKNCIEDAQKRNLIRKNFK